MKRTLKLTYKLVRRIIIFIVGVTIVAIGVVMIVTPGPAVIVIPAGLAVLGMEFAWARHWMKVIKEKATEVANKTGSGSNGGSRK